MISLLQSEGFKREYQRYSSAINNIEDKESKEKAKLLLGKLINEIKILDSQNQEMFFSRKVPIRLDDSKKKISDLRKELDQFLNDVKSRK